jgi:hypothetical protein
MVRCQLPSFRWVEGQGYPWASKVWIGHREEERSPMKDLPIVIRSRWACTNREYGLGAGGWYHLNLGACVHSPSQQRRNSDVNGLTSGNRHAYLSPIVSAQLLFCFRNLFDLLSALKHYNSKNFLDKPECFNHSCVLHVFFLVSYLWQSVLCSSIATCLTLCFI